MIMTMPTASIPRRCARYEKRPFFRNTRRRFPTVRAVYDPKTTTTAAASGSSPESTGVPALRREAGDPGPRQPGAPGRPRRGQGHRGRLRHPGRSPRRLLPPGLSRGRVYLPPAGEYAVGNVLSADGRRPFRKMPNPSNGRRKGEGALSSGGGSVPGGDPRSSAPFPAHPPAPPASIPRPRQEPTEAFERKLYVIRRLVEKEAVVRTRMPASSTSRACRAGRSSTRAAHRNPAPEYFPDLGTRSSWLRSPSSLSGTARTRLPTWRLAHPFRICAHNGEINTLRGNINRMRSREATLASAAARRRHPQDPARDHRDGQRFRDLRQRPRTARDGGAVASARHDDDDPRGLGREIPHERGQAGVSTNTMRRSWSRGTAPRRWCSPTAAYLGGTLDRNGLRPARYTDHPRRTDRARLRDRRARLPAGPDPPHAAAAAGKDVPGRPEAEPDRPGQGDQGGHHPPEALPALGEGEPHRAAGAVPPAEIPPEDPAMLRRKQRAFGYTDEELKLILRPWPPAARSRWGSMGNDAALAVLSNRPQLAVRLFQAAVRPGDQSAHRSAARGAGDVADAAIHRARAESPRRNPEALPAAQAPPSHPHAGRHAPPPGRQAPGTPRRDIDMLFPADGDGKALEAALDRMFAQADKAIMATERRCSSSPTATWTRNGPRFRRSWRSPGCTTT